MLKFRFDLWIFRLGFHALRALPAPLFFTLVHVFENILYLSFSRRLRRNARESLQIAYGEALTPKERERIAREAFHSLFAGVAGLVYDAGRPGRIRKRFILEGQEHLDTALARGHGVVLAVAHFGPFAWMLLKLVESGYQVYTVARPPRSPAIRQIFEEADQYSGMRIIFSVPVRSCITQCVEVLKGNGVVVTPIDQNYGGAGRIFVPFFGRPAATAPGTVLFAQSTGAQVLFGYALPEKNGQFRLIITPGLAADDTDSAERGMAALTFQLEKLVRQYPQFWSWMHRRWKAVPKESER